MPLEHSFHPVSSDSAKSATAALQQNIDYSDYFDGAPDSVDSSILTSKGHRPSSPEPSTSTTTALPEDQTLDNMSTLAKRSNGSATTTTTTTTAATVTKVADPASSKQQLPLKGNVVNMPEMDGYGGDAWHDMPPRRNGQPKDFHWVGTDEPHATRRKLILAAHPEIKNLFGREIRTLPITIGIFCFQMVMAYLVRDLPWYFLVPAMYIFSATANHCLLLISHELSHNLCFEASWANQLLAIFSNLTTGVPSAVTFKRYHMEHHQYQGVDGFDTDIATDIEGSTVRGNTFLKVIWALLQFLFYSLRPTFVKPKTPGKWEFLNVAVQLTFDALVLHTLGLQSFLYLFLGSLMSLGLHPVSGHFISEHFEFVKGVETYSYYGPLNYVTMNVGYHNEHHDFPKIPWSNLPKVRKIAPEFYDTLPHHDSWVRVLWQFITDPTIGPYSRIKRRLPEAHPAQRLKGQ